MRLILILLIAVVAFCVIQSYRHGCKFTPDSVWFDCVMGRTTTAATTPPPPPPAAPETPAPAAQ
jgi:hypothetical protein